MNKFIILIPLICVLLICIFFLIYLLSNKDPNKPPSVLINKEIPKFKTVSIYDENKSFEMEKIVGEKI